MAKIVFVNAFEHTYIGTRVLAAYLRKFGHKTHNILLGHDGSAFSTELHEDYHGVMSLYYGQIALRKYNNHPLSLYDLKNLEIILKEECPDIIGYSARSTNNHLIKSISPILRQSMPHALLVAGGFGPTLEPNLYLNNNFDVVIRGDGEEALLELATYYDKQDFESLIKIENTYWNKKYGECHNPIRNQERDLEKYPPQLYGHDSFTLISNDIVKRNYDPAVDGSIYFTYLGRGCTGKCTYCSSGQWTSLYRKEGKKAYPRRNRNFYSVLSECSSLPENIKQIGFVDEFWSMNKKQTLEFFTLWKEKINKPFWAYLQYEQMVRNKDLFELVVDAGLANTGMGFQTGSSEFLKKYYDRNPQFDIMIEYAHMLFNNYILCESQFIQGNCYETYDDFLETIQLIRKLPFDIEQPLLMHIAISRLKPLPKTPLTLIAPRVLTDPMNTNEWLYRSVLMYLANKMDKEMHEEIMSIKLFRENAMLIYDFSRSWLYREQKKYYNKLIEENSKNNDWIFYGAGEIYHNNKKFFESFNVHAILIDKQYYKNEKKVDGIPVISTEDFFKHEHDDSINYLVLRNPAYHLSRKLLRTYHVDRKKIHACEININQ